MLHENMHTTFKCLACLVSDVKMLHEKMHTIADIAMTLHAYMMQIGCIVQRTTTR
jgi:hypothetical protein